MQLITGVYLVLRLRIGGAHVHDVYTLTHTHTHTHACACHIIGLLFLLGEETKYKVQRNA